MNAKPAAKPTSKRNPGEQTYTAVSERKKAAFQRNLLACMKRAGLSWDDLQDAGISEWVVRRWQNEGVSHLWRETRTILSDLFGFTQITRLFEDQFDAERYMKAEALRKDPVRGSHRDQAVDQLLDLLDSDQEAAIRQILQTLHATLR